MGTGSQSAFISYSREDSEFALRLAEDLKAAGAAVWLDQLDIAPGEPFDVAIERALVRCPRLMVVMSPASVDSQNVQDEVSFALHKRKTIIPILYRDCEIPYRLHRLQYVDFRGNYLCGLRVLLGREPSPERKVGTRGQVEPAAPEDVAAQPEEVGVRLETSPSEQSQPVALESVVSQLKSENVPLGEAEQISEPVLQEPPRARLRYYLFAGVIVAVILLLAVPAAIVLRHRAKSGELRAQSASQPPATATQTQPATAPQTQPTTTPESFSSNSSVPPDHALATGQSQPGSGQNRTQPVLSRPAAEPAVKRPAASSQFSAGAPKQGTGALESRAKQLFSKKQYSDALLLFKGACDDGNLRGCSILGVMYEDGKGVKPDKAQAVDLYRKACDGGDAAGCNELGTMYEDGQGVKQDKAQAIVLYRKACDAGDDAGAKDGCNNLGLIYENGQGVKQDKAQAVTLFRKSCDGGNKGGCFNLGRMYEDGQGVKQDKAHAAILYRKACDAGDAYACNNLGIMYIEGRGVAKNKAQAAALFRKACDGHDSPACLNLQGLSR